VLLHYFSSAGWESWGLGERLVIPERMPVLFDDLRFEDADGPRPVQAVNGVISANFM
jgi:hypothetical protein